MKHTDDLINSVVKKQIDIISQKDICDTSPHCPKAMVITCVDARIKPMEVLGINRPDLALVRNIAGLVPEYDPNDPNPETGAALQFAVEALKVDHIIIMGHTDCGGIHAKFAGTNYKLISKHLDKLGCLQNEASSPAELEKLSIINSYNNLKTYEFIAQALSNNKVQIHAWLLNTHDGSISVYMAESDSFEQLSEIYK